MPGTYTVCRNSSIPPVQNACHKVLIELKKPIEKALQEMVDLRIIIPVTEPTELVSSLIYSHKPDGSLCLCLDPCDLSKES